MKKLLMVVSTLNHGGAQKVFANLTLAFPKEWEIDILLNSDKNIAFPYRGNIISLDIDSEGDRTNYLYLCKVFFKRYNVLRRLKRKNNYDACISALESANVANVLTGNKKCRTILTVHSFTSKYMRQLSGIKQKIIEIVIRLFYNHADKIVVVSESARNDLIHNFRVKAQKTATIYNGFQIGDIISKSKEILGEKEKQLLAGNSFKFVAVGRLEAEKGYCHLIRSLKRVKEDISNIKLVILGEGSLRKYLLELIKECGLENNVVLYGFDENPYRIMSACDGFIMTSLFEGFPSALVEGLACSLPCVSCDFDSGAREILAPDTNICDKVVEKWEEEQYGILCPLCDGKKRSAKERLTKEEAVLADAMIALVKDIEMRKRLKEKCLQRAWQLDIEKILNKWMELL